MSLSLYERYHRTSTSHGEREGGENDKATKAARLRSTPIFQKAYRCVKISTFVQVGSAHVRIYLYVWGTGRHTRTYERGNMYHVHVYVKYRYIALCILNLTLYEL